LGTAFSAFLLFFQKPSNEYTTSTQSERERERERRETDTHTKNKRNEKEKEGRDWKVSDICTGGEKDGRRKKEKE